MSFADPAKGRSVIQSPGPEGYAVTVAEAVKEGDILGYSSGWKRALATTGSVINPQLIALKDTASGKMCPVANEAIVTGYSGGTPGGLIYLAEGTSYGQVTDTAPSTTGDVKTIIGVLLDAATILFNLTCVQVLA
jgi:hypothetical protein